MMYLSDLLSNEIIPVETRDAVREFAERCYAGLYVKVLVPTSSNNDIDGSQRVSNGGTDFTYQDATVDDVIEGSGLAFYEYFRNFYSVYTGHWYEGEGDYFSAIVVDPPAYAVEVSLP